MSTEDILHKVDGSDPQEVLPCRERLLSETAEANTGRDWLRQVASSAAHLLAPRGKRARRPRIAGTILIAVVFGAAAFTASATVGGAAANKNAAARAAGVAAVVSQVQSSFNDGQIAGGSVGGSILTVSLAAEDGPSITLGNFEAGVLAHAVRDWMAAQGQEAVTAVREVGSSGSQLAGSALGDSIAAEPSASPLTSGACETAAQDAPSSLVLVSARTLPFADGTCVFKFTTADPATFAATASSSFPDITSALPDANDHPFLIEVDDQAGTPQVILSWVPGVAGQGQGQAYVAPGLPNTLGWG